jgi:hypothetical protein
MCAKLAPLLQERQGGSGFPVAAHGSADQCKELVFTQDKKNRQEKTVMKWRNAVAAGVVLAAIAGAASRPAAASVNRADAVAVGGSGPRIVQITSNLLVQVHSLAEHVKSDAGTLEYLSRANHSTRSQIHALREIRDGVGSLGRLLGQLVEFRDEAEPWQQAIDRISPVLESLAARTEAATRRLGSREGPLLGQDYQEHVSAIAQTAKRSV